MTLGYCNLCEKWGGHIDSECKWDRDPQGRRRYRCGTCGNWYLGSKGLVICKTVGCGGEPKDVGPKKMRKKVEP